ncbi:DEAD/DEAH box helicase [Frankia sp. CNm7]|uniref:DEAD/DEAH box helicase n=1 Tax=Frankia nepalensis TaxID=1836974 RepID=A0A937UQG8_9ACTN|nr:DEAD/DEAH box helicase [Frankia nepalensis]MBL7495603.1 DEAD/DEAH box helicase [Frankia nepalensis]MBL7508849.1 DEAD/DEAH box helicase [Frankia nepalensis]MBL7523234.1 DEAD/DEAH box helicase [Frankia nepalensis]MBL7630073.1 DEAD/DEAH box helicase [Frankia nepalensis]
MLVVHGVRATASGVWLWAEDTRRWSQAPGRPDTFRGSGSGERAPGPTRNTEPAPHPFAALPPELAPLATGGPTATPRLAVFLPSAPAAPLASPDLAAALAAATPGSGPGGAGAPAHGPVLRRWLVDTIRPEAPLALGALREPGEAFRLGASALFLLAVDAFAADLVDRGRVLPAVGWDGARPLARWQPVLTGPDAERFDDLTAGMPPAFRAVGEGAAAGNDPAEALGGTLDDLVDAHARGRLRRARRTPSAPGPPGPPLGGATAGWLRALGDDPRFTAAGDAAHELATKVETWRSGGTRPWPTRVCFRLGEPGALSRTAPGDADAWRIDFLVQAVEDPGVRVPAGQVWRDRPTGPATWATETEESLLAGLGRAVAVWPELGRALREARPTGLDLTLEQAQEFLRVAGSLEQEGFGVLVPSWWARPVRPTPRLAVRAVNPMTPILRDVTTDLDQIVDFRWAVSLGDVELSRAELDGLARAKSELVKVRGRWTRVDPGTLAGLDLARRSAGGRMAVRDVLPFAGLSAHPAGDDAAGTEIEVVADGWLGALLAGLDRQPSQGPPLVEPPAGLGVRLRPYQAHGLAWLALLDRLGVGAVLADDMGLGKTIQVLALELLTRDAGRRGPTLVVCPTSVLGNWLREAERVAPGLRVHTHHADRRRPEVELAEAARGHDLVLTTYTQLARDVEEFRPVAWERLVLDEAQQIKNSATAQARAARRLTARHRVALTGTPVENRLGDLWSIMRVVNPGLLGSASSFRARYAVPIERYGDADATARLRRRIRPVVLRRVKTDPSVVRDLPAKAELRQLCTLTTEQASLYRAVVDDMMERLRDASSPVRRSGVVLAAMTRLKQVCNHPAHLLGDSSALPGRSGKLARLEELLAQVVAGGERALCFTQFARFGAMLAPYLSTRLGVDVSFLHGGLRPAERDRLVERFQTRQGPGVFLLSLKAGGTGVNLTAANHVIHIDRWWNPAVEAQATDRAHRIGQRRDVWVQTLLCMGTLEERIDRILTDKAALARTIVGGGESWLGALSTDELRDLVALAPEAVHD